MSDGVKVTAVTPTRARVDAGRRRPRSAGYQRNAHGRRRPTTGARRRPPAVAAAEVSAAEGETARAEPANRSKASVSCDPIRVRDCVVRVGHARVMEVFRRTVRDYYERVVLRLRNVRWSW